ncbi:MAG: glycosyl transferase family 2 [Clostridiales bacterium]|nr:glycosyl transferase family 2 [Clostridiales bacterium]
MNKYKVYVYAICKNEEQFVDLWMDCMNEADGVFVLDTGSEDRTVEKLIARGAIVKIEIINPWRFDIARNISLQMVPEYADICVCTDMDERFEPGWRTLLETNWIPGADKALYTYNWSLKPDGTPDTQLVYSKIHRRNSYIWKYPVHEYLKFIGTGTENTVDLRQLILNHYPDMNKSRRSYLTLLKIGVQEDPTDERMAYYLGREYMYIGNWNECISTLLLHLTLPHSVWPEERAASMRWIAKAYQMLGDTAQAYLWYFRAIAECPYMRDAYVEFALMAYNISDWNAAYYFSEEALKITRKNTTFVNMGYAWDHTPNDIASLACWNLGLHKKALEHAKKALAISPIDKRLRENVRLMEGFLLTEAATAEPVPAEKADLQETALTGLYTVPV